jgi:hypothetical protein
MAQQAQLSHTRTKTSIFPKKKIQEIHGIVTGIPAFLHATTTTYRENARTHITRYVLKNY